MKYKRNLTKLLLLSLFLTPSFVYAVGNTGTIATGADIGFAWSENAGYVNFGLSLGDIKVTDTAVTGYAWDSIYGWLNLGPIVVGGVDYGVKNTTAGVLSGYAWSAGAGWVPFEGITIDANGKFKGVTATSAIYGRLTFDCPNYCDVHSDWKPAVIDNKVSTLSGSMPISQALPLISPPSFYPTEFIPPSTTGKQKPVQKPTGIDGLGASGEELSKEEAMAGLAPEEIGGNIPKQLFDITFTSSRPVLSSINDFAGRVMFNNFGTEPTLVDMVFRLEDSKGKLIQQDVANITIESEGVYVKRYSGLDLPSGVYNVKLHTKYNTDVQDDFSVQITINKVSFEFWKNLISKDWAGLLLIPFLVLWLFILVYRRRKNDKKLTTY